MDMDSTTSSTSYPAASSRQAARWPSPPAYGWRSGYSRRHPYDGASAARESSAARSATWNARWLRAGRRRSWWSAVSPGTARRPRNSPRAASCGRAPSAGTGDGRAAPAATPSSARRPPAPAPTARCGGSARSAPWRRGGARPGGGRPAGGRPGRRRIGQQPDDVPGHDHVERPLPHRRPGRVPDQDLRPGPGELGAGQLGHPGRPVHGGDPVPLPGGEQREAPRTAPEVQHVAARGGQPALQPGGPRIAYDGVEQPVVGLLVEGSGGRVPVDRRHAVDTLSHH
ncbi:hypothetical protein YUWDRAFT_02569 [Streptomyces sp. AmelKG-D3]|nr:hypothetical protein YUWDRAFT_02569 [Streptomyces sp. AmelKG-D3]